MIISTLSKSRNFATAQTADPHRIWTTNAFRMTMPFDAVVDSVDDFPEFDDGNKYLSLDNDSVFSFDLDQNDWMVVDPSPDHITMDLRNPITPKYHIQMTHDGDNTSYARAACGSAITLYGRYETVGQIAPIDGERVPLASEVTPRGQGSMECPMYDLEWVAERTGYPCKATEMPVTTVHCDAILPKDMTVNTLIDLYFNWMANGVDMNTHISANASRMLNVQIQCDRGREINPGAHAGGMSGGKLIMSIAIGSITWEIAYKHETANDNSFPFLSFAPINSENRVGSVEVKAVVDWVLENWETVEHACAAHDCDLFGVTLEKLKQSYIDSPHVFNEVLGEAVGTIKYRRKEIIVEGFDNTAVQPKDYAEPDREPGVWESPDSVKKKPMDSPSSKKPNAAQRFLFRIAGLLRRLFRAFSK